MVRYIIVSIFCLAANYLKLRILNLEMLKGTDFCMKLPFPLSSSTNSQIYSCFVLITGIHGKHIHIEI